MQIQLKKTFFCACLEVAGAYFWIALLLYVINFINNILIIITIYKIFTYKQFEIEFTVVFLLILLASRFFLGCLSLVSEKKIRKRFCSQLIEYFNTSNWESNKKPLIATIISRDILTLLETFPTIPKLLYYPACIIIGIVIIYKLMGIKGIFAISSVVLFIPISLFISKKSIKLAIQIYDVSKLRLEEVSKWIEWRSIIFNWAVNNKLLKRLIKLTENELRLRTLDSMWRSLDLYVITFGRCLPISILIIISMLFKNNISNSLLLTTWLSVPFISLIMEAGRFTADFKLGNKAFHELQEASKSNLKMNDSDLTLDNNWEIWDGTLPENCLITEDGDYLNLLLKLRLTQELGTDYNEIYLSRFGSNVSEGQKTRILLIRAIYLAIKNGKTLKIERTLNSLDPEICRNFSDILKEFFFLNKIVLSESCHDFLENQLLRFSSNDFIRNISIITDKTEKLQTNRLQNQPEHTLKYLITLFNPLSIAFIFPAASLSLVGCIVIANLTLSAKLFLILALSILSIGLAVLLGVKNEKNTRNWSLARFIDIILNSKFQNTVDIYQRLSKDFSTVVERITWYVHDIAWLFALLLVSIIAIIFSFGLLGILITIIFLVLSCTIWKIFENKINIARKISVSTLNEMLIMGENLICYGSITDPVVTRKRKNLIESTLNNFYKSNNNLISLKIIFSNSIMCVSGLLILTILIGSAYRWISLEALVFILTAILAVDTSIVLLFQALSGFSSQRISITRLLDFEKNFNSSHGLIEKRMDSYFLRGISNQNIGVNYLPIRFEPGNAYSIVGASGIGKTQFLKIISGLSEMQHPITSYASILYMDKNSYLIEAWIQENSLNSTMWDKNNFMIFIKTKIFDEKFDIIILDEALTSFNKKIAQEIAALIQSYVLQVKGLLLLVDHRFTLDKSISIFEIQSSVNIS